MLVFLTLLIVGGRLIKYFGIAAQGGMDVTVLLKLVGFQLPYLMEYMLPLSFFIALMLVLGRLYVDHEMSIFKTAGISPSRVGVMLAPLALGMVLLQAGLTLWAKPWGLFSAEKLKVEQAIRSAVDLAKPGEFISFNNLNIYIGGLSKDKRELLDVMVIQQKDASIKGQRARDRIIIAQRAVQVPEAEIAQQLALQGQPSDNLKNITMLDLYNGRQYDIGKNNVAYNTIGFSQYRFTIVAPDRSRQDDLELEARSTQNLIRQLPDQHALAELGYRFTLPLVMLLAILLAIPLSKVNPRQGRWLKLLPSILLFATSVVSLMSLKGSVAKGKVPLITYFVVLLLYVLFALYVYNKNKVHKRVKGVVYDVAKGKRGSS